MAKYNVGDKVNVIDNLNNINYLGGLQITPSMAKLAGTTVTIMSVQEYFLVFGGDTRYEIKEDNGKDYWSDECFEYHTLNSSTHTYKYNTHTYNPKPSEVCRHKWRKYIGLNERYQFCENQGCKAKRGYDE
jgi:hypothetical protein